MIQKGSFQMQLGDMSRDSQKSYINDKGTRK